MLPRRLWKKSKNKPRYVDTVANSIKPLPLPITNTLSKLHNNTRPQVDCFATNLLKSSSVNQDVVTD